jgi:hypothetical protein
MKAEVADQGRVLPRSVFEGVDAAACSLLNIGNLGHRSALKSLGSLEGSDLVGILYRTIASNYAQAGASANKERSRANWRWCSLQAQIGPGNRNPEVVLERAIAAACRRAGRRDWANQIPVASGLINGPSGGRCAIDLVTQRGKRHFEFIELKIESNTPLYAAIEIIRYTCLWLLARADPPSRPSELLEATRVDLRVLAPASYYAPFKLQHLGVFLNHHLNALGQAHGVTLTFDFDVLPDQLATPAPWEDEELLSLLASRCPLFDP